MRNDDLREMPKRLAVDESDENEPRSAPGAGEDVVGSEDDDEFEDDDEGDSEEEADEDF